MSIAAFALKHQGAIPPKGSFVHQLFTNRRTYLNPRITLWSLIFGWVGSLGFFTSGIYLFAMEHSTIESVYRTVTVMEWLIPAFAIMAIGILVKVRDGAPMLIELARCLDLDPCEFVNMSEEGVKYCARKELAAAERRSDNLDSQGSIRARDARIDYHYIRLVLTTYNLLPETQIL